MRWVSWLTRSFSSFYTDAESYYTSHYIISLQITHKQFKAFYKIGVLKTSKIYATFFYRRFFYLLSAVRCRFGHIYWRNPLWKTSVFVQCGFKSINFLFLKNTLICTRLRRLILMITFKVGHSSCKKVGFICFNESPLKMVKNSFYTILKPLFVLDI